MQASLPSLLVVMLLLVSVQETEAQSFAAALGTKNKVSSRKYLFRITKVASKSGTYSDEMVSQCKTFGMKPVCDHRYYCRTDDKALYIGQTSFLVYGYYRKNARSISRYFPSGFATIKTRWDKLCSYVGM